MVFRLAFELSLMDCYLAGQIFESGHLVDEVGLDGYLRRPIEAGRSTWSSRTELTSRD